MKNNVFICIEGLDGSGKTTQTKLLVKNLRRKGFNAIYTAEPTRGKVGRFIRKYYLHCKNRGSRIVEALLFAADRYEHIEKEISPLLKAGGFVISDRYIYSSLAYQGAAGLSLDWIKSVNEHVLKPSLALFLDVDPKVAMKRLKPRKSVMENVETQQSVRDIYMKYVDKGELTRVDGNRDLPAVAESILSLVLARLEKTS